MMGKPLQTKNISSTHKHKKRGGGRTASDSCIRYDQLFPAMLLSQNLQTIYTPVTCVYSLHILFQHGDFRKAATLMRISHT